MGFFSSIVDRILHHAPATTTASSQPGSAQGSTPQQQTQQTSAAPTAMRDVDVDVRSILVARAGSEIKSPTDLAGKQLVLGSSQAAEATVLPLHFLKKGG